VLYFSFQSCEELEFIVHLGDLPPPCFWQLSYEAELSWGLSLLFGMAHLSGILFSLEPVPRGQGHLQQMLLLVAALYNLYQPRPWQRLPQKAKAVRVLHVFLENHKLRA
jgi:hypothetical protein